jgi:hypothetical protein
MVRAGGLFILVMGVGVVLGGLFPRGRKVLLAAGGAAATIAITVGAAALSAPLGVPTRLQLWFLFGAIVAEAVLIGLAVARYKDRGERALLLVILFVVGLHFLPMAVAFGPFCAALGVAASANAAAGLWFKPSLPLNGLWVTDGLIKIAFGALMLLAR